MIPNATVVFQQSGTLAAATPLAITIDLRHSQNVAYVIKNTGATNPINTVAVGKSPCGNLFATDTATGSAIGVVATGTSAVVEQNGIAYLKLQLTLTSTAGTTYSVELRGE